MGIYARIKQVASRLVKKVKEFPTRFKNRRLFNRLRRDYGSSEVDIMAKESDGLVVSVGLEYVAKIMSKNSDAARNEQIWLEHFNDYPNAITLHKAFDLGRKRCFVLENGGDDLTRYARPLPREDEDGLTLFLTDLKNILQGILSFLTSEKMVVEADNKKVAVIHNDLKPGNILVKYNSESEILPENIKVIDFTRTTTTTANVNKNLSTTPQYRSPESLTNESKPSAKSDIWSVGLIAYYLLTGEHMLKLTRRRRGARGLQKQHEDLLKDIQVTKETNLETAADNLKTKVADKMIAKYNAGSKTEKDTLTKASLNSSSVFTAFTKLWVRMLQFVPEGRIAAASALTDSFFSGGGPSGDASAEAAKQQRRPG